MTYRADIYALACVLHECLTGGQPYPADSVSVVITAHLMSPIPQPSAVRPGIRKAFDEVISRGMAKDPKDRYATAGELAVAAHDAPGSSDQDKADTILERSSAATVAVLTPPPAPPGSSSPTPPPFVAASTQPPYPPYPPPPPPGPGGWGPPGPVGPGGPGGFPPGGFPPGGPPPWQPPPSDPMPSGEPPNRNWVPIVIAAVVAFLLVVAGVVAAVVLLSKSGGNTSNNATSSTTTASTSQTTAAGKTQAPASSSAPSTSDESGASARLMTLLPDGYGPGACKGITPVTDALATVDCQKNTQPGGPDVARYSLFPDQGTLDQHFSSATKEDDELVMCPASNVQSPTTWHYTSTPDKVEGQVACGTYKGGPDVIWTRNADLMLADGQGPDLPALHDWWLKYG